MPVKKNPWKPQPKNLVYVDKKRELGISYDNLQWIVKKNETYYYYRNMSQLFSDLLEDEVKEIIGKDLKTLLSAIEKATIRLEKVVEDIKLKEDYVTQRL